MAVDVGTRPALAEVRCPTCGTLQFKAAAAGRVEIVCRNRSCRRMFTLVLR